MNHVEVLAPAGSKESLKAAILGGADAIYLGGKLFGARRFAPNFDDAEMKCAVKLAHENEVKVYVTVNTLTKQKELSAVFSYLDFLSAIDVDAVIVQDRGLVTMIRDHFPLPIHASTQMGIHSAEDAIWAQEMGIERAILSRELGLEELRKIRERTSIGLEVFIHGALCYAFSGQCLFSSLLGGRSGNRGMCAQPCRKRYFHLGDQGFLLSTADLFSIFALPDLISLGIEAIKIEGRLRSPTYVFLTSKIYSQAVRRARKGEPLLLPREQELLEVVFNRGFSGGYLLCEDVMQKEYPESRGLPLGRALVRGREVEFSTDLLKQGDGVTFYRNGEKKGGFEIKEIKDLGGKAVSTSPFRLEMGEYEAYKTKDREFGGIEREIAALPFPSCQGKRRELEFSVPEVERQQRQADLSFYVSSLKSLEAVLPFSDRIYFEWNRQLGEAAAKCQDEGTELVVMLPRVSPEIPETDLPSIQINSPGQYLKFRERRLYGSYFLNMFNSLVTPSLFQQTISVELSKPEINDLLNHFPGRLEAMVFGRLELMVTKDRTLEEGTLIDERGKKFPVNRDRFGYGHILNSSDLFLLDFLDELEGMGIDSFGIDLRRRSAELCTLVAKAFFERDLETKPLIKKKCGSITAGHYLRGVL